MVINRTWAMPSPNTFSIRPIEDLLLRWLPDCKAIVDPFARSSGFADYRNDLDPDAPTEFHLEATTFCHELRRRGVEADAVLFDPPYSPRQISECYRRVGLTVGMKETQNGRFYKEVRDALNAILAPGGIAISCGWNSSGFGKTRGYAIEEILLVCHGGAHNDTIVVVERKIQSMRRAA